MVVIEPVTSGEGLRRAFGCFPTGVTAVCALVGERPVGLAASSFTSVSLVPPLVSVCLQHSSRTWPLLRGLARVGVSVLAEGQGEVCARLGARHGDRFAGTGWTAGDGGSVFVHGAAAWLDCSVHAEVPSGDHVIVLLRVLGLRADPDTPPLVFHGSRYRRLAAA
jgi:flavin reductase (DIM6/NTAB) family NADH-FMN oxidoreductase RutF